MRPSNVRAILAVLSGGAAVRTTRAIDPGARGLTVQDIEKMIATDMEEEFGFSVTGALAELANEALEKANDFEWEKAAEAETLSDQKYPYMLCHTGESLSGYQRILALADALGVTTDEEREEKGKQFRPLYNGDDFLCVYGHLLASEAAGIAGEEFVVQPVLPALKMLGGIVDEISKEMEFVNDSDNEVLSNPSLDIALCPGVSTVDDGANDTLVEEWEDISKETAGEIVEALDPTGTSDSLANKYYLTSEDYSDLESERAKLWIQSIQDYQESGKCKEAYEERLDWTIKRASSDSDVSVLNVAFEPSGDTVLDFGCMLPLVLAIAEHPDVCSLESRERVAVQNTEAQWLVQSEVEERRPFFDSGLDGSGQMVAVSDTGIDPDNCYFADKNGVKATRFINKDARKVAQYIPFVDDKDYQYGHGTHVAGTVAGKRLGGDGMADGVAPGAELAFIDIGDRNGALSLPPDSVLLNTGRPFAKIHSASWGSELNLYTLQARNFDQYMYDNDDFLIMIAAGNSGAGDARNTVGSPATGKNIIAVGAHHNYGSSAPDRGLGPSYVADFSSRGPTFDGRMKPDIMAPGKTVLSAGALPTVVGECDPSKKPGPNGKADGVLSLQGTSMATPIVSATAAMVRQYFEEGYYPTGVKNETNRIHRNPSGALVKAVLMNGAQFMKGVDNGINGVTDIQPYDNNQGFGRLALQHSLYLPGKTEVQMEVWDRETVEDQDSNSYEVKIDKSSGCGYEKLSVTLVWVDFPGVSGCTSSCLINNLDLSVELGGKTFYPNGNNGPDLRNNAERVIIDGVKDGDVAKITVRGTSLVQRQQIFSLVATGCFGGVANQNFDGECSVFECDDSQSKRLQTILMAVFIPLGVLCLCGIGLFFWRKRG